MNVAAYAVRKERSSLLTIINKDATALLVKVDEGGFINGKVRSVSELWGPALKAERGVVFRKRDETGITALDGSLSVAIPPYSAITAAFS